MTTASAQEQLAQLVPPGASDWDVAGWCVAVSGNTAAVGASGDVVNGIAGGSVCVYRRDGTKWVVEQLLTASDAGANDDFGYSATVDDDVIVVGAALESHQGISSAGAAYVFRRAGDGWTEEQKLVASDGDEGDLFGTSVAVDGDIAVIGAAWETHGGLPNQGAVYVFRRSAAGWVEEQKLTAPESGITFGRGVGVLGDTIVVGAPDCAGAVVKSGAVFAYRWTGTTWGVEQKLFASDGQTVDNFGFEVSLSGDRVLVGSPAYDNGYLGGAAYVFRHAAGQWVEEAKLESGPAQHLDNFGSTVSLSGDIALVGGGWDTQGFGQAHVYRRIESEWPLVQTLQGKGSPPGNSFAGSVALSGESAVAGAVNDDAEGVQAGSAFAFALNWNDLGSGLAGESGEPLLLGYGSMAPGQRVWLSLTGARHFAPTVLVIGATAVNAPFKGGVMVPSPDRTALVMTNDEGQCDLNGLWPSPWPSGLELIFQAWSIDPSAPDGFAASNAVSSTSP